MKRLADGVSLSGVEVISVSELRARVGECLTQAQLGKSYCIKRKGEIVAFLVPASRADVVHEVYSDGSAPTLGLPAREQS